MKKLLLSFFSVLILSTLAFCQTWSTISTQNLKSLTVHNGNLYGSSTSGPFKSTDGGVTWTSIAAGLGTWGVQGQGISSVGTYLYYGSKDGLYRSSDEGATWTQVNSGLQPGGAATSKAVNKTYLFSGTYFCTYGASPSNGGGIYSSTDGVNWTASNTGLDQGATIYEIAEVDGKLFALSNLDLYESTDGGANWTSVGPSSGVYNGLFEHQNGRWLMHTFPAGIRASDDKGATWTTVSSTIKGSNICGFIQGTADTIYAYTSSNGVFYSVDAGDNWTDITGDLTSSDVSFMQDVVGYNNNIYIATFMAIKANGAPSGGNNDTTGNDTTTTSVKTSLRNNTEYATFPNPFQTNVSIANHSNSTLQLELIDVLGKSVLTERSNQSIITLQTETLIPGLYLVVVKDMNSEKIIYTEKVMRR